MTVTSKFNMQATITIQVTPYDVIDSGFEQPLDDSAFSYEVHVSTECDHLSTTIAVTDPGSETIYYDGT